MEQTCVASGQQSLKPVGGVWAVSEAIDFNGRTIWIVDAHRGDGKRFIVHADEKLSAFVELERQVLTVTFYLECIHHGRSAPPRSLRFAVRMAS
jgi:hypothetical protein